MKPVAPLVSAPLCTENFVGLPDVWGWAPKRLAASQLDEGSLWPLFGLCFAVQRRRRRLTSDFLEPGARCQRDWQPASKMSEAWCLSGFGSHVHRRRRRLSMGFLVPGAGHASKISEAGRLSGLCYTVHRRLRCFTGDFRVPQAGY